MSDLLLQLRNERVAARQLLVAVGERKLNVSHMLLQPRRVLLRLLFLAFGRVELLLELLHARRAVAKLRLELRHLAFQRTERARAGRLGARKERSGTRHNDDGGKG